MLEPDAISLFTFPTLEYHHWDAIPWEHLEREVKRSQERIFQASQRGEEAMYVLQQELLASEEARLLAVRHVTGDNEGRDTAGVDGVKSLTDSERLEMAFAIHPAHWDHQRPQPVRRIWIPKPGKTEKRPIGIVPMLDRCKQALVKLALEPEWEARFEAHSYGFRPHRSTHDAVSALAEALEHQPSYVFDADVEGAFDHVNQELLVEKLHTFPALTNLITGWLKAGVLDDGQFLPSEIGITQGGPLSPLLMNVALHGMESVIHDEDAPGQEQPLLVRFADDFVILHPNLPALERAASRITDWLAQIGLHLNAHKTRITHTLTPYQGQVGFDFLGFSLRQYPLEHVVPPSPGYTTVVAPDADASAHHLSMIEQRLHALQAASQEQVIAALNPLIAVWSAYYRGLASSETMSQYDDNVTELLVAWAVTRHPRQDRDWLLQHYWQPVGQEAYRFATPEGRHLLTHRSLVQQGAEHKKRGS
jgi:RNA-directed DNA polymerase